jgi:hypothetical protein
MAAKGEMRNEYKILVGKPEGRKQLGRMDPRDIVWEDAECIHLTHNRNPLQILLTQ